MEIFVRDNNGEEHSIPVSEDDDVMREARRYRTVDNYMVCIIQKDVRILRWDRPHIVNNNHWRRVAPDAFETLGKLPVIVRVN